MKANRLVTKLMILLMAFVMIIGSFSALNEEKVYAADENVVSIDMTTTSGSVDSVTITDSSGNAVSGAIYSKSGTATAPVIDVTLPHGFSGSGQMKAVFSRTANESGYPYVTPKDNSWAGVSSGTTYGARTDTYTTTLSGGAGSLTAYVYEGNNRSTGVRQGTVKINYSVNNTLPKRKSGVSASTDASIVATETYSLDLSSIFEDPDGDAMTYKVKVNDAAAVAADEQYTFTTDQMGDYALVFTANDGVKDSTETYTVNLTVSRKAGTWYITNTSGTGYSTSAAEGSSSPVNDGEDYTVKLNLDANYECGEDFAIKANGVALEEDSEGSNTFTIRNITEDKEITVEGVELKKVIITAPSGSTVKIGYEQGEWTYHWYDPVKIVAKDDGTAEYRFTPLSTSGTQKPFFRVQNPNGATYWNFESMAAGKAYTVTMNDLTKNGTMLPSTIYHDFRYNYLDLGDIYLTVNDRNYLPLSQGGTHTLNAFRNWNPINSFTNDMIAIPDFHYEVVDINGNPSDLVTVTPDENISGQSTIKASNSGSGLAIIKVTYDALIHMDGYASGYGAGGEDTTRFGAIWPECTGIIVVSVGQDGSAIDMGMTINTEAPLTHAGKAAGDKIDAEHDLLYYYGDEGAEYTFKPEAGATVSIARSTVGSRDMSFSGFTTDGVETDDEGNVTVTGLTAGRHIVKVEKDGVANYQVLSARQVTIEVKDEGGEVISDWETRVFAPGDTLSVRLHNVNSPQEKLAQCYNNSFSLAYYDENDTKMAATNDGTHGYGQYNFSSVDQVVTVPIPEDWTTKHTYELRGAVIMAGFSGTAAGGHRAKGYGGGSGMAQGTAGTGALGRLPLLTFKVNAKPVIVVGQPHTISAPVEEGASYEVDLSQIFTDPNGDDLTYTVSVNGADPVAADSSYSFQVSEPGVYRLAFRANDGTAESDDVFTAVVKCGVGNIKPMRKGDVEESIEKTIGQDGTYELDLSTIFEDADEDPLTYKVSVNGADYAAAPQNYVYTPEEAGEVTLVFKANDGSADSDDTFTVNLTVLAGTDPTVYWDSSVDGQTWYPYNKAYGYVTKVNTSNVRVKKFEWTDGATCNITLIKQTADDAEFDFTVEMYTRLAAAGVRINGTQYAGQASSTLPHTVTVTLSDGQASASVQPYYNNRTGTLKTFNFTVEQDHIHEWGEPTYEWAEDNSKVTAKRVCTTDDTHVEEEEVETTSEQTKAPTCTEKGETTYKTKPFTNEAFTQQTKTVANIDAVGHQFGEPEYVWADDNSKVTATVVCSRDATHKQTETKTTTKTVDKQATATEDGQVTYTVSFTNELFEDQAKKVTVPAYGEEKINIDLLAQVEKNTLAHVLYGFEVSSEDAGKYGYSKPEAFWGKVTMSDVAAALHHYMYGEEFDADPTAYLNINNAGTISKIFGEATYMNGFKVNDKTPEYPDQPGTGSLWNDTPLEDGDDVRIFQVHGEYYGLMESYLMFDSKSYQAHIGGNLNVTVTGDLTFGTMSGMPEDVHEIEDATVALVRDYKDPVGTKVSEAVTDEDGVASFENLTPGEYDLVITDYENDYGDDCFSTPYAKVKVTDHAWSDWRFDPKPTSTEDGLKKRECSICHEEETETVPAYGEEKINIDLLCQIDKNTLHDVLDDFEVSSEDAGKYGYNKPEAFWGKVTVADACAALHYHIYGEDFVDDPQKYLKISDAGTATMIFGEATYMNGFKVNDKTPEYPDQPGTGSLWNDTPLVDGDKVRIFQVHGESYGMMESYLMFDKTSYEAHVGGSITAEVTGDLTFGTMMGMPEDVHEIEDATVALVKDYKDPADSKVAEAVSDEDGVATFENLEAGEYHLVVTDYESDYGEDCFSTPYAKVTVTDHDWDWVMTKEPTLDEEGLFERTCSICEKHETKVIPKLTEATVTLRVNMENHKAPDMYEDLYVRSNMAYKAGLVNVDDMSTVSIADALVAAHAKVYGTDFHASEISSEDAQLTISMGAWGASLDKMFGLMTGGNVSMYINNDNSYDVVQSVESTVTDGDLVSVALIHDTTSWSDKYIYYAQDQFSNDAAGNVDVKVMAKAWSDPEPVNGAKVVLKGADDNSTYEAVTDENGIAKFMPDVIGTYTATVEETQYEYDLLPAEAEVTVNENAHTLAIAKASALVEVEAYVDANSDKADEDGLEAVLLKAEKVINKAGTEAAVAEAVADAKAKVDALVEEHALNQIKKAAIEDLKALSAENKDKVLDPDKLELVVLEAIEDVRDAETEADVEAIKAAAIEAVQALVDEKTAADEAAEQAAQALADAKTAAAAELDAVDLSAYSEEDQSEMQDIIDAAKAEIAAAETVDEVESILASAKEDLGEYSTPAEETEAAKAEALAEIEEIDPEDYVDSERAAGVIRDAKTAIAAAEDPEDVQEIMSELYEVLDSLDTEASVEELIDDMIDEIDEEFDPEDYVDGDQEAAKALIDKAKEDIAKAKTSSEIYEIIDKLYEDLGKLTTNEEENAATEDAKEEALEKLQDMLVKETGKDKILAKDKQTAEVAILKAIIRLQGAESAKDVDSIVKEAEAALKQLKDAKVKADKIAKQTAAAKKLKVKGLKAKSKKLKFKVSWKKTKGAGGYQVQYKLKSAKKFSTLKASVSKVKVTSKKLKKGKKYIFRVRTWKKVAGKKVYGKWAKTKAVKCK